MKPNFCFCFPITGEHANGATPSRGAAKGARRKDRRKKKGEKTRITAAANPGYDVLAADEMTQESSYEAVDSVDSGQNETDTLPAGAVGFDVSAQTAHVTFEKNAKEQSYEVPKLMAGNEYATFAEDALPPGNLPQRMESGCEKSPPANVEKERKKPPPKPMPKTRKDRPAVKKDVKLPPPSAGNHLVLPSASVPQYLDMSKSKPNSNSGSPVAEQSCNGKDKRQPVPRKTPIMIKEPSVDSTQGAVRPSDLIVATGSNPILYDTIIDRAGKLEVRRGSDARVVSPSEGGYVLPGTISQALAGKGNSGQDDDMRDCTYLPGDEATGLSDRPRLFNDSYDAVGKVSSSNPDFTGDMNNHYDVVVNNEEKRKSALSGMIISKQGYAFPRQASIDMENPYENQRRYSASLTPSRNKTLPGQHQDDSVYDVVEVKDSNFMTTGRALKPKIAPKKHKLTGGKNSPKATITRSTSGPSLLANAELDSVYVNTARF